MGRDHTLFAKINGHVLFGKTGRLNKKIVSIVPI